MLLKLKLRLYRFLIKFSRFFVPVLCICVVFLTCIPAHAAEDTSNNYLEYYTTHQNLSGDMVGVELSIPLNNAQTEHKAFNSSYVYSNYVTSGSHAYFPYTQANRYKNGDYLQAMVYPLGFFTNDTLNRLDKTISLKGIPAGSMFSVIIDPTYIEDFITTASYVEYVYIQYYDKDGMPLSGGHTLSCVQQPDYWTIATGELNFPSGATCFRIVFKLQTRITEMWPDPYNNSWEVVLGCDAINMRIIVPESDFKSAFDAYERDKVVDSIEGVGDKVDDTNDLLDDVINGTVDPERPSDAGKVEDLDDLEDSILDDMSPGLDAVTDVTDQASQGLKPYFAAFFALSNMIDELVGIPFFSALTYLSLALGISGTVLGISNSILIHSKKGG